MMIVDLDSFSTQEQTNEHRQTDSGSQTDSYADQGGNDVDTNTRIDRRRWHRGHSHVERDRIGETVLVNRWEVLGVGMKAGNFTVIANEFRREGSASAGGVTVTIIQPTMNPTTVNVKNLPLSGMSADVALAVGNLLREASGMAEWWTTQGWSGDEVLDENP